MKRFSIKAMSLSVAVCIVLTGCATPGGGGGNSAGIECDPALAALAGGILGAVVDKNHVRGAAIGAGVAALACVVITSTTKQTKSGPQVEAEYKAKHGGELPSEPQVDEYKVSFSPNNLVKSGGMVTLLTDTTVVAGKNRPIEDIYETAVLYDKNGKDVMAQKQKSPKPTGSQGYGNKFTWTMPQGLEQGLYPIKTTLYVNGKPLKERKQQIQLVQVGSEMRVAILD